MLALRIESPPEDDDRLIGANWFGQNSISCRPGALKASAGLSQAVAELRVASMRAPISAWLSRVIAGERHSATRSVSQSRCRRNPPDKLERICELDLLRSALGDSTSVWRDKFRASRAVAPNPAKY